MRHVNRLFTGGPVRATLVRILFLIGLLAVLAACGDQRRDLPAAAAVTEVPMPVYDYRYGGAEVLRVALDQPRRQPDARGRIREWRQAYQVRMVLSLPPVWGPVTRLYLDDELVPEYGGWTSGIYFWVYDPERLQSLDGRTIRVQTDDRPLREVGRLELKATTELPLIPESELRAD